MLQEIMLFVGSRRPKILTLVNQRVFIRFALSVGDGNTALLAEGWVG